MQAEKSYIIVYEYKTDLMTEFYLNTSAPICRLTIPAARTPIKSRVNKGICPKSLYICISNRL